MKYLKKINELNFDYKKSDRNLDDSFQREGDMTCRIYVDDEKAGFMHYRVEEKTFHIIWLNLIEKYRGLGNGDKIINELESKAKEEKCNKMTLEVIEKNKVAINLYKKHGFEIVKKDNIFFIMRKNI